MAHLTFTFKLLQTKGLKGRVLHEAMQRWTTAHREFLDLCAGKVEEFDSACSRETPKGVRRSKLSLDKWVRQNIKTLDSFQRLESSMKDSLISHLGEQLLSYLELTGIQRNAGVPTGRGAGDLLFEQYIEELTGRAWVEGEPEEGQSEEFVRTQGKVQGYRPKLPYTPVSFCRYDTGRNYCIVKSEDGKYFALLCLLPEGTGFTDSNCRL